MAKFVYKLLHVDFTALYLEHARKRLEADNHSASL